MAEYIEREAALHEIERREALMVGDKCVSVAAIKSFIKNRPAADVAQVVHGRWIEKMAPYGGRYFECSNCGAHENIHTAIKGYYCWRCGARMDGDSNAKAD